MPDTRGPGFAEEVRRQCEAITAAEDTAEGRAETAFWEAVSADTWGGLE